MNLRVLFAKLRASTMARQATLLVGAQIVGMLLSFVFTAMITRSLSVADYGLFRFGMTFLAMAMTIMQLGWPYSAARLLAIEHDPGVQRRTVGAAVVLLGVSATIGCVGTFVVVLVARTTGHQLPAILVMLAPFVYVSLGQQLVTCVCQGLNRINLLAMQQIAPYAILLPLTAIEIFIFRSYSLPIAVANYLVVFTAIVASGIMRAGVSFTGSSERIRDIRRENKTTGFPLYVGGLFGVASAQVIALWVTQYTDSTEYGYYALGLAISSPLGVLVSAVGSVIFRASAEQHSLSRGVLWAVFTFAGLLGCVYWAGTVIFLVPLFGAKYAPALPISHLLGVGALMIGCGDIFQRFLGAKGRGALLGTAAVCTGVVGVSSAAFLLRPYGVYGAAFSSILAGTTYLFAMVFLYLNRPRGLRNKVDSSVSIL